MLVNFGVIEQLYPDGTSTGEVASILEDKYHVMRTFVELHEQEINNALVEQMAQMLDNSKAGAPLPFGEIRFGKIEEEFRRYLELGEWEATSGQPTQAALDAKSKRKKAGKYEGQRPSFIDTGLYSASNAIWITP